MRWMWWMRWWWWWVRQWWMSDLVILALWMRWVVVVEVEVVVEGRY